MIYAFNYMHSYQQYIYIYIISYQLLSPTALNRHCILVAGSSSRPASPACQSC